LTKSPQVDKIYTAPGNGGISKYSECVDIKADALEELAEFAEKESIDVTIVGPEAPLAQGIVDMFRNHGLRIFGPTRAAAEIESSKVFAKELMKKYNIPSAKFESFTDPELALNYLHEQGVPIVIKADGLAAGKGVIPCTDMETAERTIKNILVDKKFGDAGNKIVIEEYLEGEEVSILAFTDGENILPLVSSQDHKRIFDNDQGPNTGGMGAYSPAPVYTPELDRKVFDEILARTVQAMNREGRKYQGILYAGLMITADGPKVVEFNCRFGDPELQAVLPRMKTDIIVPINAVLNENLNEINLDWRPEAAVCVVMASGGYPDKYESGKLITGLKQYDSSENVLIFHAGTKRTDDQFLTSGGRVLGVTSFGEDIKSAIENSYAAVNKINFENAYFRKDIGYRALNRS
ncbi:MAG: phosphoribosylamine--glycine ligase, partial [Thermoplasmata archaeon]|nr:phosphoribosylamine--glycine ligase [Thermoplasmata archaeon]